MKIILLAISVLCFFQTGYSQPQRVVSGVGEWKLEDDEKSRWTFKSNGQLHKTYQGMNFLFTYSYESTSAKPYCPGMEIGEKPNITYLKTVNDEDGDINCFYVFALNDERLTLIDASTGMIMAFIRVE